MLHRQLKCYVDTSSSGEFDLIYNTTYLCRYKKKSTQFYNDPEIKHISIQSVFKQHIITEHSYFSYNFL